MVSLPSASLTEACRSFYRVSQARSRRCAGITVSAPEAGAALFEDAYTASCVGVLTLPGALGTVEDVDACTLQVSGLEDCRVSPPCVAFYSPLELPDTAQPGLRLTGEPCQASTQCSTGLCSSWVYWLGAPTACGVCVEVRGEGQNCDASARFCQPGLTCLDGVCSWYATEAGKDCVDYGAHACPHDLYCDAPEVGTAGVCKLRPDRGQPCEATKKARCREELYCLDGVCVDLLAEGEACDDHHFCANHNCHEGTCQSPRFDVTLGGDCSFHQCSGSLVCSPEHVCQEPTVVGEGEYCSYEKRCDEGLVCSTLPVPITDPPHCVKPPVAGGPCVDLQCDALSACIGPDPANGEPGHCEARHGVGQPCPCVEPLQCLDGACQPLGSLACP